MASDPKINKTIYLGTFIHCLGLDELEQLENAAVGVDEQGVIGFVERHPQWDGPTLKGHPEYEGAAVVNEGRKGRWFFPGFVDTHIHASQFQNAGVFGKTTLLDWLRKYTFPTESAFSDLAVAEKVYTKCVKATLAHGTTTATYFTTIHVEATNLMADICQRLGQRAFVGRVCMDSDGNEPYYRDQSPADLLAKTVATIEHMKKIDPSADLISPIITPRSALQCTDAGLKELGALHAATRLPIQTHVSENRREIKAVTELFPQYSGYLDIYDKTGLLSNKTVLAHSIHLSQEERLRVKACDAKVSHCPVSNTSIASGLAPIRELLDMDIDVSLGTDISGGYSPSILTAAREASGISRLVASLAEGEGKTQEESDRLKLSVAECLYLGTRGGARALNLSQKIGGFEVGKAWDVQLIDVGDWSEATGDIGRGNVAAWGRESWEDVVAKWMFCGDDRNTLSVWVQGRLVHIIAA